MNPDLVQMLETHYQRYQADGGNHQALLKIAEDRSLASEDLFALARADVQREMDAESDESGKEIPSSLFMPSWVNPYFFSFPLVILQQRVEEATLQTAFALLEEKDPASRILAAKVLRELPGLDDAPQPHSQEVVERLQIAARAESNDEVLHWLLAAIGWQCLPASTEFLLNYVEHPAWTIRLVVSDNLLMGGSAAEDVTPSWQRAVMTFLRDEDEDVQWSMLYEIKIRVNMMMAYRQEIEGAVRPNMASFSKDVREQAEELLAAFEDPTREF